MEIETPCMGGWCARRSSCPHYLAESRSEPDERLCIAGRDGELRDGIVRYGGIEVAFEPPSWPTLEAA